MIYLIFRGKKYFSYLRPLCVSVQFIFLINISFEKFKRKKPRIYLICFLYSWIKVFKNSGYDDDYIKALVLWWTKEILQMKYDLLFVRPSDRVLSGPSYGRCEPMF